MCVCVCVCLFTWFSREAEGGDFFLCLEFFFSPLPFGSPSHRNHIFVIISLHREMDQHCLDRNSLLIGHLCGPTEVVNIYFIIGTISADLCRSV